VKNVKNHNYLSKKLNYLTPISFRNPNPALKGWFGGCGQFECTGDYNILVHDQDGSLLGTPKQVISNNPWFAP
jgi:hypothetical protein